MRLYFDSSSDDDAEVMLTPETAQNYVLTFGKYTGEELGRIVSHKVGQEYLRFMLTKKDLKPEVAEAIGLVLADAPEVALTLQEASDVKVPFGEFKGQSVGTVARIKLGRKFLTKILVWEPLSKTFPVQKEAFEVVMLEYKAQKKRK